MYEPRRSHVIESFGLSRNRIQWTSKRTNEKRDSIRAFR
jgi:hypothetical protein